MKSDLSSLYPSLYRGVLETDMLARVGDAQHGDFFRHMDEALDNQFILTADSRGIEAFERLFEIGANPLTESLGFRRERVLGRMRLRQPFSMRFLRGRLDSVIGAGQYHLWLDHKNYTLFIEAAAEDAGWYQEVHVMVGKIKPANIVFTFVPLVAGGLSVGETVVHLSYDWAYRLGRWSLGREPFARPRSEEVLKLPSNHSLREAFFEAHAAFTAEQVERVLLNDTFEINTFQSKRSEGDVAEITYMVPEDLGVDEITNIKLLSVGGDVLSDASVYIPAAGLLTLRHTITHKEVSTDG